MSLLPGWWEALALEARRGMESGAGPYWSGRFLCGQPLFGSLELPFSGPDAPLLLAHSGAWCWLLLQGLVFTSGLALWMRSSKGGPAPLPAVLMATLLCASLLVHPDSAALLGAWAWLPWAVLLSAGGAGAAGAPFCALLICGASPLAMALGLLFSRVRAKDAKAWSSSWGLGLLLAGPAVLEFVRQAPGLASVSHPGWPLAFLGSPLAAFEAGVALLMAGASLFPWTRARLGLVYGLGAGLLAMGAPLFMVPHGPLVEAGPYLRQHGRHEALYGQMPRNAEALEAERWTGAGGGLGPVVALRRWRSMDELGARDETALSLSDVAWIDVSGSAGIRWYQPVTAAMVEGALPFNVGPPPTGMRLFERPLRVMVPDLPPYKGTAWHFLDPRHPEPGRYEADIPPLIADAWLFLSENYDAGWTAEVGPASGPLRPATVLRTEEGFLAVALAKTDTQAALDFRPPTLLPGFLLAFLGFFGFAGMTFWSRMR